MIGEAAREAADNLLRKAAKALAADDEERAARFVARAVALPYDAVDEMHPAAASAAMMLFTIVGDEAEARNPRWIDAAAEVLPAEPGWGRSELLVTLGAVWDDYDLDPDEVAGLRALLATPVDRPELQSAELVGDELAAAVTEVLNVVADYVAVLESRG
ncbi:MULTISPECIES: hypothetical protein [unclassified Nocardioides]|uniref:hypothetical protein n=1 Tax=unclassified Nocardioides TaxID=2615069 RepID=UPI0030151F9A